MKKSLVITLVALLALSMFAVSCKKEEAVEHRYGRHRYVRTDTGRPTRRVVATDYGS